MNATISKTIKIQNSTIEYFINGEGKAVIFLHGAATSALENWAASIEVLSGRKKVIAINFPGAGRSNWTKAEIGINDLEQIVKAILHNENITLYDVVGFSTGAMVALQLGTNKSSGIEKLIAIAPWLKDNGRSQLFFETWGTLYKADPELFHRYNALNFLSSQTLGSLSREILKNMIQNNVKSDIHGDMLKIIKMNETLSLNQLIPQITASTLIIGFSDDRITLTKNAKIIASQIPGAAYLELEAGHAGPWEATEPMNETIVQFLVEPVTY